jgi:hypothetical protein
MNCLTELHTALKVAEDCMYDVSHDRAIKHTATIADLEISISHCLALLEQLNQINKDLQCGKHMHMHT